MKLSHQSERYLEFHYFFSNFCSTFSESGASDDPCSDIYGGPYANSEPETQAIIGLIDSTPNVQAYISLHAYGQYILYPFGYTATNVGNALDLVTKRIFSSRCLKKIELSVSFLYFVVFCRLESRRKPETQSEGVMALSTRPAISHKCFVKYQVE